MTQALRLGRAGSRRRWDVPERHLICGRTETLVGLGFRCWMAGFQTGDISLWQRAWQSSAEVLGTEQASAVCGAFSRWVRAVRDHSSRELEVLPSDCPLFGRDECVAIALIAAYQHQACPALQACAMTLLGCEPRGKVADLSHTVAERLRGADHVLAASSLEHVVRLAR